MCVYRLTWGKTVYLVTDLALGGELFDRICRKGSYYESDAADLIRATLSAVAYLHDHGIVHRDLKPENLLFRTPEDNADLLIADFGLSRIMDEERFHVLTTTCGTPGYMAPEIFKKTGHGKPVYVTFFLVLSLWLPTYLPGWISFRVFGFFPKRVCADFYVFEQQTAIYGP